MHNLCGACMCIDLQVIVFNHLVDRLSPTRFSFHVDRAIVSSNICQVTWQVSTQICYHVDTLSCVVFTSSSNQPG